MKKIFSVLLTFLAFASAQGSNINWSSPPTTLSGIGVNASNPQVAINSSGVAVAVWIENNLIRSSFKNGSSWGVATTISSINASSPGVVIDSSGNATAIWVESGVVKSASKTLFGSWGASTVLSSSGASSPTICVDSAGDVVAAWARSNNIETSTKLFGLAWGTRTTITASTASNPVIAAGGTGTGTRIMIVWQGVSSGINVIQASTKTISGPWSAALIISDATRQASQPYPAVDQNGNASAIWYAYDLAGNSYANVAVKSATRSNSTGTWSPISTLSSSGVRNPSTLTARIAYDSIGNTIALWNISFDDETFNIESAVKPVNGTWGAPVDIIANNLYAYSAQLAVTTFGDTLSLYQFYNGNSLQIQTIESDINGFVNNSWSVPITISQGTDNAFPQIAASLSSNTINTAGVWLNFNGTNTQVVAATGSKTLVLPPTGLHVAQSSHNFGVFNEFYNTLTWTASTDPNVVGYLIFRNGIFLEQVGAGVTSIIDDNRANSGSVTYGVSAIDAENAQSTLVTVSFP